MSKITLKPLDDGQKAVEIPVGKTTIGRGPFLGCSDKKVSRNHAVLEVTSKGEVYLTPTHVNPCFYQPTADSPGQILKKDIPHKLENGDSFSLLPRAFRYQLIVAGDTAEDKSIDQNDLSKQAGKTNGAASDGPDGLLNEGSKDAMKGISSEELNDTTVTEKPLSKEEEILPNIDKNSSKEDNTFSKKLADITEESKTQFYKEEKEVNEEKDSAEKEKSPPKEYTFSSEGGASLLDEKGPKESSQTKEENCSDDIQPEKESESSYDRTDPSSKTNELHSVEGKSAESDRPKPSNEKIVEENESTLGNDNFPKESKSELDELPPETDKTDVKSVQDDPEVKTESVRASNGDGSLDTEPAKDAAADADEDKARTLPDWMAPEGMPPPSKGAKKKPQAAKQPRQEKPPKRKTATEGDAKPKGRKKVEKFDFDDGEEGNSQRRVAGRTSSRTNRQTRQGLSLEDFIVSDDDEWQSDRSDPKPRRKRGAKRGDDSGSDWEVEHKKTKKPTHKFGSGSESGSDWGSQKRKKGPKGRRKKNKRSTSEAGSEEEVEQSSSNVTKGDKPKIPCTYGKKCYRRNQNHLDQFSHPGDSDHASEPEEASQKNDAASESEGETNKKECPYGANCFRKNAQHKKDFKHTKKVRPQREAAKQADKKTKSSRNSEEVDSYDLNDSFLNDDSDEYKPVDSGSDYESGEKMKRFTKGKAAKNKRGKKV